MSEVVGGALTGAAGGAQAGAVFGPYGAAIGGVLGGIAGGLLGKKKDKLKPPPRSAHIGQLASMSEAARNMGDFYSEEFRGFGADAFRRNAATNQQLSALQVAQAKAMGLRSASHLAYGDQFRQSASNFNKFANQWASPQRGEMEAQRVAAEAGASWGAGQQAARLDASRRGVSMSSPAAMRLRQQNALQFAAQRAAGMANARQQAELQGAELQRQAAGLGANNVGEALAIQQSGQQAALAQQQLGAAADTEYLRALGMGAESGFTGARIGIAGMDSAARQDQAWLNNVADIANQQTVQSNKAMDAGFGSLLGSIGGLGGGFKFGGANFMGSLFNFGGGQGQQGGGDHGYGNPHAAPQESSPFGPFGSIMGMMG